MKRAITNHLAGLGIVLALAAAWPAQAGEGHDHGDAQAAPSANGPQRQPDGSVFLPKPAQRQLGVAYAEGLGVRADPLRAFAWLQRAAEQGENRERGESVSHVAGARELAQRQRSATHRISRRNKIE